MEVVSMLGMPWRENTRVEGRLMPLGFCGARGRGGQEAV